MRNASSFDWDTAAIARLTELWLDGVTSGEIGRLMGISRSAAMGKLRRLDLLKRDDRPLIPRRMPARLLKTNRASEQEPQKRPHSRNKRPAKNPETYFLGFRSPPPPPPPLPPIGSFDLLDLRNGHCRWPEGNAAPFSFCGARQAPNSSYCEAHARLSRSGGPGRPAQYFNLSIRAAG